MNKTKFYAAIRPLFGGALTQAQVNGIEGILGAAKSHGDGKLTTLAYALATAYHETGQRMVPVREGFATTDAGARKAVAALAAKRGPASAVARYAKPAGQYGHVYYGRGHVQLTWLENYQRSSADAGADLVRFPDLMLDPTVSARVLIRGLIDGRWNGAGKGLGEYLPADPVNARRTVNVLDKAEQIAGYYRVFLKALQDAEEVTHVIVDDPGPKPAAVVKSGWAAIAEALTAWLTRRT